MTRSYRILLLISALLLPSCDLKKTDIVRTTPDDFFNWFVNPWAMDIQRLIPLIRDSAEIDSSLRELRKNSKRDTLTVRLSDPSGIPYTLGIKPVASDRQDTTWPLVIYLHGGTGTELDTKGEVAWDMLSPLADTFNLFLASPSANRYAPWWSAKGLSRILQTIRYMTLQYRVNPEKIFLAGVSDGATGCYAAANTIPAPFAGFIAISGYGGMLPQLGIELFPSNLAQRPMYNVNAGKDRIYPIETVNRFLDWLESQGVNITRKEYPDELHGFDYKAKEMGNLANLIRTWSLPSYGTISWSFTQGLPGCPQNIIDYRLIDGALKPSVLGVWHNDTLALESSGISDLLFEAPGRNGIVMVREHGKITKVNPYTKDDLIFAHMQHTQFISLQKGNGWYVHMKE